MKAALILSVLVQCLFSFAIAANTTAKQPLEPYKLIKKLKKEKFTYIDTGLLSGFMSVQSCLFTSKNFVVLKNYCFPNKKYPARGFTVMSPKYGIYEFYQENMADFETRNFRVLVFAEDIDENFDFPIEGITFEKVNRIKDYYYKKRNKACWATNYSLYNNKEEADCLYASVDDFPKWKSKSLKYTLDQVRWHEEFDNIYDMLAEPAFALSLTQIYNGRKSALTEVLYSPAKRYADIVQTLNDLNAQYPDHTEVFELTKNNLGESVYGIKIGSGSVSNLVVGTHHGNEYGAAEVAEAVAVEFAKTPITGQSLYVIPVLNTNGYDKRSRREALGSGGTQDPNRDYPGPCGTAGPFKLKSTRALADFVGAADIVNSVTLHTYYPGVLYPWGISTHDIDTGHTDLFREISFAAAHFSNYKVGNSTIELYPADGTFEDYAYWQYGVWSLLFEMGFTHYPSEKQVAEMIEVNVPGIRKFFEMAPTQRAADHSFKGQCNGLSLLFDRHDE